MKKIVSLTLALVMLLACCMTAFAATIPASKEQELVPVNGSVNGDNVGWVTDKDGNFVQYVNKNEVSLTTLTDKPAGLDNALDSISTRLGANAQLTVTKMFDVTISGELEKYFEQNGSVTLRFVVDLKDNETLHVLHNLGGSEWEEITGSRLSVDRANGTVDVTFYSLSPVVFAVSTTSAAPAGGNGSNDGVPTSPATGLSAVNVLPYILVVCAAAAGCVALSLRRKRG